MKNRIMKKSLITVFLITLLIVICGLQFLSIPKVWAASGAKYTVDSGAQYATNYEGEITITISMKNDSGLKVFGVNFQFSFDSTMFEFVEGKRGAALPVGNITDKGKYILIAVSNDAEDENDLPSFATNTVVATLSFKLKKGAIAGKYVFGFPASDVDRVTSSGGANPSEIASVYEDKEIMLTAPSTSADLTALSVKNGSTPLNGTWTTGGMTTNNSVYTVSSPVGYSVTSIGVTPTASANATVTVKGEPVASGASKAVNLDVGANSVEVKVTAQDGKKVNTFTIKVTRQVGDNSTDLQLIVKGAEGAGCDVQKDGDVFTVAGTIPFVDADGMKVIPTANALSVIKVAGAIAATGTEVSLTLKSGKNEIAVTVTSQAGTKKDYTLVINVSAPNVANTLSELVLTYADGTVIELNAAFAPETTMYFVRVTSDVTAINVAAKTTDENSIIVSGLGSQKVPGVLEIVVRAQNGAEKTYQIAVVQIIVSEEESIKDVIVNGEEIDFEKDQLHYDINVNGNIDKIDFSYLAGEGVIVEIFGNENLKAGNNTVLLKVEQPNGVTITYTFSVHKPDNAKTLYFLIAIALGVLVIILIGAVIIILKKKKGKTPPAAPVAGKTESLVNYSEVKNGTEKFDGYAVADSAIPAEVAPVILTKTATAQPTAQKKTAKTENIQDSKKTKEGTVAVKPPKKESSAKPAETTAVKPTTDKKKAKPADVSEIKK